MTDKPNIRTLRCSSLDPLWGCHASVLADGPSIIRIKSQNDAATLGHACHDLGASLITAGVYDVKAAAEKHALGDAAREDASLLMLYAARAWKELAEYFPSPVVESYINGPELVVGGNTYMVTGTMDACSPTIDNKGAIFLDWKSGYIDDGYHQQMAGYAYLLWNHMGRPTNIEITGVVVFLRHRYYRVVKYDATSLSQWEYDLTHNILPAADSYSPGSSCRFCDLFASCVARQAVAISTVTEILGGAPDGPNGVPGWWDRAKDVIGQLTEDNKAEPVVGEILSDVLFRVRLLKQMIENAKGMMREAVEKVGPIPLGGGEHLVLREVEVRKIKPVKGFSALQKFMSNTQIAECSTISLPKVLTMYGKQSTHTTGSRKEARERLLEQLETKGAITVNVQKRLESAELDEEGDGHGSVEKSDGQISEESGACERAGSGRRKRTPRGDVGDPAEDAGGHPVDG